MINVVTSTVTMYCAPKNTGLVNMPEMEPEYIFKKGEGWVITTEKSVICTTLDNKKIRIIERAPIPGEYHSNMFKEDYKWATTDGVFDLKKFQGWVERAYFDDVFTPRNSPKTFPNRYFYVTVELL